MRTAFKIIALALLLGSTQACVSLSSTERTKLAELKAKGVIIPHEKVKEPALAGMLNILPGFGNFYLGTGTDEGQQWLFGFLNLLMWPISVVWGIPEAAIDADTINKRDTVYFYTFGPGKDMVLPADKPAAAAPPQP